MGRLSLKVVPGSSRDEIVGWLGDSLKVKVMSPPEKGHANEAVALSPTCKGRFSCRRRQVTSLHPTIPMPSTETSP